MYKNKRVCKSRHKFKVSLHPSYFMWQQLRHRYCPGVCNCSGSTCQGGPCPGLHLQALSLQVIFGFLDLLLKLQRRVFTVIERGHSVSDCGQRVAAKRHQQVQGHRPSHVSVCVRQTQVQQVPCNQSPDCDQQRHTEQPLQEFSHDEGRRWKCEVSSL